MAKVSISKTGTSPGFSCWGAIQKDGRNKDHHYRRMEEPAGGPELPALLATTLVLGHGRNELKIQIKPRLVKIVWVKTGI